MCRAISPYRVSLRVSTTGTDADFVVKLIDVYPTDAVAFETSEDPEDQTGRPWNDHQNGRQVDLRGYQQLVRAEPFRGKYRHSFEHPEPFVPGEPTTVSFTMPDICHCFCEGQCCEVTTMACNSLIPYRKTSNLPNRAHNAWQSYNTRIT